MLQELRIKNFAIIDELSISFSKGLNILTGETGAGKSIILNAVQLLRGEKAGEELVRSEEEEASIEALFDLSENPNLLKKFTDEKIEEPYLLIKRIILRSGRGRVYINGNLATLSMLSDISEELLSIYGQHEHQLLQKVETHIDILDEFGELVDLRREFQRYFEKYTSQLEEIKKIREIKEKGAKERELMEFQSREIEAANIRLDEEDALKAERSILINAKRLSDFANYSEELLYSGEGSAIEKIQMILRQGHEVSHIDPKLLELTKNLESLLIQLEEIAIEFRDYSSKIENNPERLEEIENRIEELERLKHKYGKTLEDVLAYKKRIDETLRFFSSDEDKLKELESSLEPLKKNVFELGERLSQERKRVSIELKKAVEKELASLGMRRTIFEVYFEEVPISEKGKDRVEFLISPNPGEHLKPLAKIASGGELSRIMLAIKRILAKIGGRQVLIFDEVDSGIGGSIAEVVGRKLKELSKYHQVICVTHLPQIACFADRHYNVRKEVRGGRTTTRVTQLEKEAIIDEIARMLGGIKITEKTRAHAKEMIENAKW
jgi:DNA repair protein RecN (Recombination protein N)